MKATSPIFSHLLPATQAQSTSLIGWNGNFLSKFGERGDDQLSEPEDSSINGDSNIRELKQLRRRRQLQKTTGLMIKTTALHMHHAF